MPLPSITPADHTRMRERLFFEGAEQGTKLVAFWVLLVLAAVIATAGVAVDSTATVIGAMIVAPLMTPILGIVLALATGDGRNLLLSVALVLGGTAAVVAIGYAIGTFVTVDVAAETSGQVAGRVSPRLLDLLAAIATGAVGAFALVRADVSDTLPGVAIAISLVPPLAVVGLTLEAGASDEAAGAFLLYLTNVAAILLTGLLVMTLYRVGATASGAADRGGASRRAGIIATVAAVIALGLPLAASSARIVVETVIARDVRATASSWAVSQGWEVVSVETRQGEVVVRAVGPTPAPDPDGLRTALDAAGLAEVVVQLDLVPAARYELRPADAAAR
jgi:uncharacterized hydrophobic protein (TIGR00271 family)